MLHHCRSSLAVMVDQPEVSIACLTTMIPFLFSCLSLCAIFGRTLRCENPRHEDVTITIVSAQTRGRDKQVSNCVVSSSLFIVAVLSPTGVGVVFDPSTRAAIFLVLSLERIIVGFHSDKTW